MIGNAAGKGGRSIRISSLRRLLLPAIILTLLAVVGYALQREVAKHQARQPVASAPASNAPVRALSREEEDYAAALWPIHSEVKLSAVEMSFAGIGYKMGDQDAQTFAARVRPLADRFKNARARVEALPVPGSMTELQQRYLGVLTLYESAVAEMVSASRDGEDGHLVAGQQKSLRATEDALRIGNVLWPGEYKPH